MRLRIPHIHSSGRYDRSQARVAAALAYYGRRCSLLTLTEYQGNDHRAALADFAAAGGWSIAQAPGPAGNCVVVVDRDYTILEARHPQLTRHEQRRGPGGPPPPHAPVVALAHNRTGGRLVVSVAHLPPNVEGDWDDRNPRGGRGGRAYRVWLWLTIATAWRREVRAMCRRHKIRRRILVADFNLNVERRWVRAALRTSFPGLRLTWRRFPGPGTHHARVIDATLTNLRVVEDARLLDDDPSSDHRPYRDVLGL